MGEAAEARKEMVQFMRESREETRRILEDSKKDNQTLVMQMMTMMKEIVGSLKQSDGGGSNVVAEAVKAQGEFLANSIKTQSENSSKFMEMMINMNKSSKEETASAARVQSESQTKMVEMVVNNVKTMAEVSKGSGDKMQELFLGLLTKQINHNPMKEVLDLMRQGEDRAAEKYEMVMEIMEKNRAPVTDPNADPFSNILAGVIDRFTRGGGGAGASRIAGGAQPANMTPEQINEFARAIAPVVQAHMQYQQQNPQSADQAALPPPSQMPPAQQPVAPQNPPVIQTADLFGDGDMDGDGEDYPTIGAAPPQQQAAPQHPPPQQQPAPQQPQPATPPKSREEAILMSGGEEIYTRNVATQIIHMAIRDAQNKAQRASWVEAASVWLTDAMQKALADAADVPHKALVIQQKCDPAAFDALKAVTTQETYMVFCSGLSTLSEMIKAKQLS